MIIGRKSTSSRGYRYVGMVKKSDKEMWFKAVCSAGEYVALVRKKYLFFLGGDSLEEEC